MKPATYSRAAWVIGTVLVTASVSGYFMGLRQTGSQLNPARTLSLVGTNTEERASEENGAVRVATAYALQNRSKDGPNARWENHVAKLVQTHVNSTSLSNVTEAERATALYQRAARRAYDGAPPVVPHPIAQNSAAACLACHGPGLMVKDKVASKVSHSAYTSCTQCHVPVVGPGIPITELALREPIAGNDFAGLNAPLKGSRAWLQAPPTIPHATLMRGDCLSCHGPQGLFGLRTPHPGRQSCMQCHLPEAELDQRQFLPAVAGQGMGLATKDLAHQ